MKPYGKITGQDLYRASMRDTGTLHRGEITHPPAALGLLRVDVRALRMAPNPYATRIAAAVYNPYEQYCPSHIAPPLSCPSIRVEVEVPCYRAVENECLLEVCDESI